MKNRITFALILLTAFFIRIFGINWDQGFHLHPDERMLIMVADGINFFRNLNPNFFNYGSLPIYLLKGSSQLIDFLFNKDFANYSGMLAVGRRLSVFFDLITICFVYKTVKLLFKESKTALFSALFYTIAFFPIQNSHFFVVDVLLNTFITGLIYMILLYLKSPSIKKIIILSMVFAAMMATKFTAIIFLPVILLVIFFKSINSWKKIINNLLIFGFFIFIFYFAFMPYAFIENNRFITDIREQLRMNSDPYIFPYTLQYVGTLPYFYYLKNIFFWGLGPIISILSLIGGFKFGKLFFSNSKNKNLFQASNLSQIIFFSFYLFYFLIIGRSAVKFMRYMLPLYPFFSILAGYGLYKLHKVYKPLAYIFFILSMIWSFTFINIYSQKHTRIAATEWILKNIPKGALIATEHWDDGLPIFGGENYTIEQLTLYEQPDDENKWRLINELLKKSDYIIIASNRLYIPLQKLSDCQKFKSCYPKTAEYYKKLFSNRLSFKKAAEFSDYPKFQILNFKFQINDDSADESFTVYDHPKIMIFKRND